MKSPLLVLTPFALFAFVGACSSNNPAADPLAVEQPEPTDDDDDRRGDDDDDDDACKAGSWDHDGDPDTACTPWSTCSAGSYVSKAPSARADRVCTPCAEGTFSGEADAKACEAWTNCLPGSYVTAAGTETKDRQCAACPSGQASKVTNASSCVVAEKVTAGTRRTCALLSDRTVKCWGENTDELTGMPGDSTLPGLVVGLSDVIDIAAGSNHTCALIADGTVKCWGSNLSGQLGDGTGQPRPAALVTVSSLTGAKAISARGNSTCALLSNGSVQCWGTGPLGDGTSMYRFAPVPVPVANLTNVEKLASGTDTRFAILKDGTVKVWGSNDYGLLANGTASYVYPALEPVEIPALKGARTITAGWTSACAAFADGTVKCWGENNQGNLGNGTNTASYAPVAVPNLTGVVSLGSSYRSNCAVDQNGSVRCWGLDAWETNRSSPTTIPGLLSGAPTAGGNYHMCAVRLDGGVSCWGSNSQGQLGNGLKADKSALVNARL